MAQQRGDRGIGGMVSLLGDRPTAMVSLVEQQLAPGARLHAFEISAAGRSARRPNSTYPRPRTLG